jgi:Holliday junction resolvase
METLEQKVMKKLEEDGFFVVRVESKGPFDFLAVRRGLVCGIQCRESRNISFEEREQLLDMETKYGIIPFIAYLAGKSLVTERIGLKED